MRKISQLGIGLFGLTLLFAACNKSNDAIPNTPAIQMSATVFGGAWNTTLATAMIVYDTANTREKLELNGGYVQPAPLNFYEGLKVEIDSFYGIGNYTITQNGPVKAWFVVTTFDVPAKSGTISVSSYSTKQVTGKFSFATDTIQATNGEYNLHVQ